MTSAVRNQNGSMTRTMTNVLVVSDWNRSPMRAQTSASEMLWATIW
jgi:hypothetical protein